MHGRDHLLRMEPEPAKRCCWPKSVEDLFELHRFSVGEIGAALALAEMEIMAGDTERVSVICGQREYIGAKGRVAPVHDRRHQPLDHYGIALEEQLQRLAEFPAADVEVALKRS